MGGLLGRGRGGGRGGGMLVRGGIRSFRLAWGRRGVRGREGVERGSGGGSMMGGGGGRVGFDL